MKKFIIFGSGETGIMAARDLQDTMDSMEGGGR